MKSGKKEEIHLERPLLPMLPQLHVVVIPNSKKDIFRKNKNPHAFQRGGPILRYFLLLLVIPNSARRV